MLKRLLRLDTSLSSANFPVYGVVKAGKSTFLSCLLREKLLPEQGLPMTSIPIRLVHKTGARKRLCIPGYDKWNACIDGFKTLLKSGKLKAPIICGALTDKDVKLFETQQLMLERTTRFNSETFEEGDIRHQLDLISHFVRLLWINEIDFEKDFGISLDVPSLPFLEISMSAFEDLDLRQFSFIDTPGPNEAKALDALRKMGPKIMKLSSGCIFCIPHDQAENESVDHLYDHINQWMAGKRVVVILTRMDGYRGGPADLENLIGIIKSNFLPDLRPLVSVHPTSGSMLYMLYLLSDFLENNKPGMQGSLMNTMTKNPAYAELFKELAMVTSAFFGSLFTMTDSEVHTLLSEYTTAEMQKVNGEELMACFRDLYNDAEVVALRGHVASIEQAHERFSKAKLVLKGITEQSEEQRVEHARKLQVIQDEYTKVFAQLNTLPESVNKKVSGHLKQFVVDTLQKWGETENKTWHIVCGRTGQVLAKYEFPGGKAGIRGWFKDIAKPTLEGRIAGKCRSVLTECKAQLPRII